MVSRVGLAHRELCGIQAIGVDEIHWGRGLKADNFLTVIYQIDSRRRLLWVGRRRSQTTLRRGLEGTEAGGRQRAGVLSAATCGNPTRKSSRPMLVRLW